jgi:5'(3')-deoxyribonucleotidase
VGSTPTASTKKPMNIYSETTNNKLIIFLDMDGVLVDFFAGIKKELNLPIETEASIGVKNVWTAAAMSEKQFWQKIQKGGSKFWSNLPIYSWSKNLIILLEKKFGKEQIFILSSPTLDASSAKGKKEWILKHLPEYKRKLILTSEKYLLAAPNRILIDDSEAQISHFIDWQGKGILFPRRWNKNWLHSNSPIDFIQNKLNSVNYYSSKD